MLKIAITGNIASGKSTVENLLIEKGYKVLDTDIVAHELLRDEVVKRKVLETFSNFDIIDDEGISRLKLGKIVFDDKKLRTKLENLLHPLIKDEISRFFSYLDAQGEKIAFVSVPLLFEAKFDDIFDKIMLVYAEDDIRLQRLITRNKVSMKHAQNRLKIQISQDKKLSLADYVIYNNGSLIDLLKNLDDVLDVLLPS